MRVVLCLFTAPLDRDLQLVAEEAADESCNVHLILVQTAVEVDSGKVSGLVLQAVRGVVARLANSAVVDEVGVQFGFDNISVVVCLDELLESHAVLLGVRLADVDEVRCLRLRWHTPATSMVGGETRLSVVTW